MVVFEIRFYSLVTDMISLTRSYLISSCYHISHSWIKTISQTNHEIIYIYAVCYIETNTDIIFKYTPYVILKHKLYLIIHNMLYVNIHNMLYFNIHNMLYLNIRIRYI